MSGFQDNRTDIIVIGGGIAGCSASWHLTKAGAKVLLLENGSPGDGYVDAVKIPCNTYTRDGDRLEPNESFQFAQRSGTAVLPIASCVKMICNLFCNSSSEFIRHHGVDGAKRYLRLAYHGISIEKTLAKEALEDPGKDIQQLGMLYVAYEADREEFLKEFEYLKSFGCRDIELWEEEKVQAASGGACAGFNIGIYFPHDAIINSAQYCKDLLALIARSKPGLLSVHTGCSRVKSVTQIKNGTSHGEDSVTVTLEDGTSLHCKQAVIATGGLFLDPALTGILKPCWSYLVGIPTPPSDEASHISQLPPTLPSPHSVNLITWGFTHDWCITGGYLRISGEDHFSALKPPRMQERCRNLAQWAYEKYPYLIPATPDMGGSASERAIAVAKDDRNYLSQYGVYSETPDSVPLVGSLVQQDRIFYCLGCNALGQAVLSYAASLLPGLMGVGGTLLTEEQEDSFQLLTIRRFCLLPGNK